MVVLDQYDAFRLVGNDALEVASRIRQDTDNILLAEATAALYADAAKGTEFELFWRDVLKTIRYGELAD